MDEEEKRDNTANNEEGQDKLEAPEPKETIEATPEKPELESAPEAIEIEPTPTTPAIEAAPALAELPATESALASSPFKPVKKKKSKKKLIIILVTVAVLLVAGCAAYFMFFNNSSDKPAKTKKSETSKNESKKDSSKKEPAVKYLSYTTSHDKLTFEYPEGWKVNTETQTFSGEDGKNYNTYIESPSGYKISLMETEVGGVGGVCNPEDGVMMIVHKEASTKITGVNVVSYTAPSDDAEFKIHASVFAGPYDTPVNTCSVVYDVFFQQKIVTKDNLVSFGGSGKPSQAEYPEVVKILASIRQES
ncbi:MAG: hypothetical protein LBG75_00980 [Candidatus Nomurabacteria bacterium]|jgi:hypothetical protein|nr:hypothetical protein [Candidatus Nomurabacteria bacterium]